MNLSDKEILELNELCNALVDDTINEKQKARLSQWLAGSAAARRFYIRAMAQSASLISYAGEMQSQELERPRPEKIIRLGWLWKYGALAAAACIVTAFLLMEGSTGNINPQKSAVTPPPAEVPEYVAQLTGSKECQWVNNSFSGQPGGRFYKGQKLELAKGFAEITFDSGAQVVLQGPASLTINSAWAATLNRGTLKAGIPPEAMGFSISNPTVEVVDLGTEFTMFADASGATTEVLVLKGEVEAQSQLQPDQQPIVLREKEARCFTTSGVSAVHDTEQKIAEYTRPVSLDHFIPPTDYMHWSFVQGKGGIFAADDSGTPFAAADFYLENVSPSADVTSHGSGHDQHALQFDGHLYARAALPDISENTPHTVVFWVKVPKDANLSNAYAMVAWGLNNKNFGSHPVHISWNRSADQGPIGVLRTDYGGGYALGSTPLRDGRWHHIAVVLIPGQDANTSMQVKQYVDGRLEGEGKPSPIGSEIFTRMSSATSGALWLGCRLGIDRVPSQRFRGEMDELFLTDRALEPLEIVGLMQNNRLPQSEVATTSK
jgi:hypothetical protein